MSHTATRWLVIGHGSVGSALVRRIAASGDEVKVYDPAPRLPLAAADRTTPGDSAGPFAVAVSCVVPAAAETALADVQPLLSRTTLYLEWNTVSPAVKQRIAEAAPCEVVDVALLDTLDSEAARPSLAVSGPRARDAAERLGGLDFAVDVVGARCGDAASLKLARSLFMKSLEALVVEFETTMATVEGRNVVARSIEGNLGPRFTAFARMLLETDRVHARRRTAELEDAVAAYKAHGSVRISEAAIAVLRAAADAWDAPGAPAPGASGQDLARFLAGLLAGGKVDHAGS